MKHINILIILIGEAIAFDEIYKQHNRKGCVTLPYVAIKKVLDKYKK